MPSLSQLRTRTVRSWLITTLFTFIIIICAFIITIASAGFDVNEINWAVFITSVVFGLVSKICYYNNGNVIALEDEGVKLLIETINNDKADIYGTPGALELFDDALEIENKIIKCNAIVYKHGKVKNKNQDYRDKVRRWAQLYGQALKKSDKEAIDKLEEERCLNAFRIRYTPISRNDLFNYGLPSTSGESYSFSKTKTAFSKMCLPLLFSMAFSIVLSGLTTGKDGTVQQLIYLCNYLFSITTNAIFGYSTGKESIRVDYVAVLNNSSKKTRELKDKIFKGESI